MLKISEIFYSIQGESSFAGAPCVFIRLSGCNLRCTYCDTRYAYSGGKSLSVSAIIKKVKSYHIPLVEITGGEPLLQGETITLAKKLLEQKLKVLIETNGSIDISKLPAGVIKIVDIKCPSSNHTKDMLWGNIKHLTKADQIKFVIGSLLDYNWAKAETIKRKLSDKFLVLFSPVTEKISGAKLAKLILKDKLPVRLQLQLHKILWPNKSRGV
jgi:7-carboxy-7-deazaguanine synthase